MKINCWISVLFHFFITSVIFSQNIIQSEGRFALDKNSKKTVSNFNTLKFTPLKCNEEINLGYNENDALWCVIHCKNPSNKKIKELLIIDNIYIDSITYWINDCIGNLIGDRTSNQDAYISAYTIPIEINPNQEIEIKLRIKKTISFLNFKYYLDSEITVSKTSRNQLSLISVFLGFLLFLIFFYAFVLFYNRKKIYLVFFLYLCVCLIYVTITSGFARYILTPNIFYAGELRIFSGSFWFVLFAWLFLELLEMKKNHSVIYFMLKNCLLILLIVIVSSFLSLIFKFYLPLKYLTVVAYVDYLFIFLLALIGSIRHFKVDSKIAFYALISFIFHFIWQLASLLITLKILPDHFKLDWFIYVSVFQAILFGYLLARNYIDSFFQKLKLEEEVISEKKRGIQLIAKTQISERSKIASILHDNFSVKIAQVLHLTELDDKDELQKQIHNLSNDIRNISHTILPKSLIDGALIKAIENQIDSFKKSTSNLKFSLNTFDFSEKIEEEWRFNLYLITLEIIHNAIKHGKATEIDLEFFRYPESYVFQFTDNGIGFDAVNTTGFGLVTMQQRIEELGGVFEINSNSITGTIIHIHIPN